MNLSFNRRSLISNEQKYRNSLEYRLFLAENPDFQKNSTLPAGPAVQRDNAMAAYDYPALQMAEMQPLANTYGGSKLLQRERQLQQLDQGRNNFGKDPYDLQSLGRQHLYESTRVDSSNFNSNAQAVARRNRFMTNAAPSYLDDINDRETLDNEPMGGGLFPGGRPVTTSRNARSVRPPPKSHLITSAKMQLGKERAAAVGQTLHSTAVLPENPLVGFSEGERKRQVYQEEYKKYALGHEEGSMSDVKERSRSKSRRAKYQAAKQASERERQESFVDLMRQTKTYQQYPNQLALKQRYVYSKGRTASPDLSGQQQQQVAIDSAQTPSLVDLSQNQGPRAPYQAKLYDQTVPSAGNPMIAPPAERAAVPGKNPSPRSSMSPEQRQAQLAKEQQRAEYKAFLAQQIAEKSERKREAKAKQMEEDARLMNDYANYYRFGALKQGGGSPIRDPNGDVVTQHVPFSSQSQHNGGIEAREEDQAHLMGQQQTLGQQPLGGLAGLPQYGTDHGGAPIAQADGLQQTMQAAGQTYSPKKDEIKHMRPSNMFEDITEDEFNKREAGKKAYQNELMQQMQEVQERKRMEKERRKRQELEDDVKIHAQLDQMREAFRKEENPNAPIGVAHSRSDTRGILKSRSRSDLASRLDAARSSHSNEPIAQAVYLQEPVAFDAPVYQPSSYDNVAIAADQLDRLKRVQQEIDIKNTQDRLETEKIVRDLIESNKRFTLGLTTSGSPYSIRSPNRATAVDPVNFDSTSSGRIRLESEFTRVQRNANQFEHLLKGPQVKREPLLGEGRKSGLSESRDAMGVMDDLIRNFTSVNTGAEEQL